MTFIQTKSITELEKCKICNGGNLFYQLCLIVAAFQSQLPMPVMGNSPSQNQLPQSVAKMNQIGSVTSQSSNINRDSANQYQLHSTSPVMNARSWSPSPHVQPSVSPGPANSTGSLGNQSEIKEVKYVAFKGK